MSKLAIVIPAFKEIYFQETLASISEQTCKNFTLYIGDDASPFNLKQLIDLFKDKISIVYKKFDENLGSKNLVAHWERCIDLVVDEDWVWLFSDDDFMEKNCVENFYQMISNSSNYDLYHFNINIINSNGDVIDSFIFPDKLNIQEFFYGRNFLHYHSYIVEYIFRKSHFIEMGGFENFDLGWGSDDALWIKLGKDKGIKTIPGSKVFWRRSEYNISPNFKDKKILERKFDAKIKFLSWIYQTKDHYLKIENSKILPILEKSFLKILKLYCENLPYKSIRQYLYKFYKVFPSFRFVKLKLLYFYFYKSYRYLIKIFKNIFINT